MCLDRLTQTEQKYLNKVTPDGDLPKLNTKQMPDFVSVAAERLGMDKARLTKVVNKTRETYGRLGQWHARKSNVTLVALSKAMKVIAMFRNEEEVTEELQKNAEEACLRAVLQESHRLMSAGEDMQNYFEQEFGINGVTSSFRKFMVMGGELNEHQKKEVVQEMRDLGTAQKAVRDACQPYFGQAVPNATGTIAAVRATTTANTTATAGPTTPAATTTFSLTGKGVPYRTPGAKEKEDSLLGSQASTAHERASAKARAKARDTALGKEVTASMAKVGIETTAKASTDSGLAFAAVLPPGSSEHLFTDPPPGYVFKFMLYEDSDGSQRMVRRTVRRPGARRSRANGKENNTDEQVPTRRCNVQIPGTLDALIARYPGSQVASTGGHGLGSEPSPTTATITDTVGRDGSGGSRNLEEVQGAAKDSSSGDRGPDPGQAGILAGGTDSPVPKSHLPNAKAQPTGSQQNASGHEGERPERNTALRSLQAGGHPGSKGAGEAGRLCMQAGPRECLLPNGSGATATQTNEDQGTELGLKGSGGATVQGRQPRPETDPRKVHKATTRPAAEVQGVRNKDNNQDRRCPDPGGLYGEMLATHMDCGKSDDLPGVRMEAEQVPAPTDAENRVPRSDVLLRSDAMLDAAREVLQGGTDHRRIDIGLNHYGDMYRKETYPSGGSQSEGHMDGDDRNGTRGKAAINRTGRHTTRDDEQPRVQKSIMEYVNGGKQARPEQPRGSSPGAEAALPSGRHGGHRYAYGGRLEMEWATVRPGHYFGDPMDGRMRLPMGTDTSGKVSPYSGSSIPLQSGGSTKLAHHQEGNCGHDKRPGYSPENVPTPIQRHDSMQDGCYDHQGLPQESGRQTDSPEQTDLEYSAQASEQATAAAGEPRGRASKHQRRAVEASARARGVWCQQTDLREASENVGRTDDRLVRGRMECQVRGVRKQTHVGLASYVRGLNDTSVDGAGRPALDQPTSTQKATAKNSAQATAGAGAGGNTNGTAMEINMAVGGTGYDGDDADTAAGQSTAIIAAEGLYAGGRVARAGLVNTTDLGMVCVFKYLRWALTLRGFEAEISNNLRKLYKPQADGKDGGSHHSAHWRRFWDYVYKKAGGGGFWIVTDVAVCNCARELKTQTESHVRAFLSSIKVVFELAWATWATEPYARKMCIKMGALLKASGPKFMYAVDNDDLWKYIVKVVTTATAKGKAITRMQQRDFAMILFKTATGCRSSDMYGWDPRDSQYCTLYDDKDAEVTSFDKAAKMQIRFKNPKDPHCVVHKNERWSYVFVVHRIRYALLIDPECEWLKTTECVQALDLFWHLHRYTTRFSSCLVQPAHAAQDNAPGLLIHGRFWMNVVQSALPGADGFTRPQPILPVTIAERTKKVYKMAGYTTEIVDDGGTYASSRTQLHSGQDIAGHMTRGNFESLMYYIGGKDTAFGKYDAVAMCRHSIATFFSRYHREVAMRPKNAFNKHPYKPLLNMTEASVQ